MGSILFSQADSCSFKPLKWAAPIQAAFAFFAPAEAARQVLPKISQHSRREFKPFVSVEAQLLGRTKCHSDQITLGSKPDPIRPSGLGKPVSQPASLKVLREFEPGKSHSSTGRLVISGRMADVCAVLERMDTQSAFMR